MGPLFSRQTTNGGIDFNASPLRNPFPHLQLATRVSPPALETLGFATVGIILTATVVVPVIQAILFTAVTIATVAIPLFIIDQIIKASQNAKYRQPQARIQRQAIKPTARQKAITAPPVSRSSSSSSNNFATQAVTAVNKAVNEAVNAVSDVVTKASDSISTASAPKVQAQAQPAKKYEFSESTEAWLKNCGISSSINAKNVAVFNYNRHKFNNLNCGRNPEAEQIALFENIMGLKNVKAEDYKLYLEWSKLSTPPEQHKNDRVLRNCICSLSKLGEYPQEGAVTIPSRKTGVYDKYALQDHLRISKDDPQTLKELGVDQQKALPEFDSIVQFRLFELAILNKQAWF